MVWWAYRKRHIQLKDLRVWFAAQELVARRCGFKDEQTPHYGIEELSRVIAGRGGEKDSLRRLQQVGLLTWSTSDITFATEPSDLHVNNLGGLQAMLAHIPNNRRKVPVPRQIVRFIAAPSKRCVIATILGHLIRCLYYHSGQCVSGGFCKAAWIAEVFVVDLRNVKAARRFLSEDLGWLEVVRVPQSLLNRYGQRVVINLLWDGSAVDTSMREPSELPPPEAHMATGLPPLEEHTKPLQELKHQKPSGGGTSAGVLGTTTEAPPSLRHLVPADLRDTSRLLSLFDEAHERGIIGGSDSERLTFIATAERSRLTATTNPPGFFAELVRRRLWHFVTQDDEDRAHTRLRAHFYGGREAPGEHRRQRPASQLSQDALFVADVSARLQRHGVLGDVFAVVSAELPEWTKARWEQASAELAAAQARRAGERRLHRLDECSLLDTL
jgi:hypothetical protein